MGNREDLLAAARRCLYDKGYARTTVRDIASAAGVSMAAIGYHFRSKDALLNAALFEASGAELGEELHRGAHAAPPGAGRLARFEAMWSHMLAAFAAHRRLLAASLENVGQVERVPEVRLFFQQAQRDAIEGITEMLTSADPTLEPDAAAKLASFYYTLMNGLVMQYMVDPEHPPSAHDLTLALQLLGES